MTNYILDFYESCEKSSFIIKSEPFSRLISLSTTSKLLSLYNYWKEKHKDKIDGSTKLSSNIDWMEERKSVSETWVDQGQYSMLISSSVDFNKDWPGNFYIGEIKRFDPNSKELLAHEQVCIVNVDSPRGSLAFDRRILYRGLNRRDPRTVIVLVSVRLRRILKIHPQGLLQLQNNFNCNPKSMKLLENLIAQNLNFVNKTKIDLNVELQYKLYELEKILLTPITQIIKNNTNNIQNSILESWYYDEQKQRWIIEYISKDYPDSIKKILESKFQPEMPDYSIKYSLSIPNFKNFENPQIKMIKQFIHQVFQIDIELMNIFDQNYLFKILTPECKYKEIIVIDIKDIDSDNSMGLNEKAVNSILSNSRTEEILYFLLDAQFGLILWINSEFLRERIPNSLTRRHNAPGEISYGNYLRDLIQFKNQIVQSTNLPLNFRLPFNIAFISYIKGHPDPIEGYAYDVIYSFLGRWTRDDDGDEFRRTSLRPGIKDLKKYIII